MGPESWVNRPVLLLILFTHLSTAAVSFFALPDLFHGSVLTQGDWDLVPLTSQGNLVYEHATVDRNKLILYGGMHNARYHSRHGGTRSHAVANKRLEQHLKFFSVRNPHTGKEEYFIDAAGSKVERMDDEAGVIVINNALNMRIKWKRPPGSTPAPKASIAEEIRQLKTLRDEGAITEEEYKAAKAKALGTA